MGRVVEWRAQLLNGLTFALSCDDRFGFWARKQFKVK